MMKSRMDNSAPPHRQTVRGEKELVSRRMTATGGGGDGGEQLMDRARARAGEKVIASFSFCVPKSKKKQVSFPLEK